jgi:hypothetical protein
MAKIISHYGPELANVRETTTEQANHPQPTPSRNPQQNFSESHVLNPDIDEVVLINPTTPSSQHILDQLESEQREILENQRKEAAMFDDFAGMEEPIMSDNQSDTSLIDLSPSGGPSTIGAAKMSDPMNELLSLDPQADTQERVEKTPSKSKTAPKIPQPQQANTQERVKKNQSKSKTASKTPQFQQHLPAPFQAPSNVRRNGVRSFYPVAMEPIVTSVLTVTYVPRAILPPGYESILQENLQRKMTIEIPPAELSSRFRALQKENKQSPGHESSSSVSACLI